MVLVGLATPLAIMLAVQVAVVGLMRRNYEAAVRRESNLPHARRAGQIRRVLLGAGLGNHLHGFDLQ